MQFVLRAATGAGRPALEKKRFERARELVQQAMARARGTLSEAREAIDDLRATALAPDDLLLAVQREINRFTKATSVSWVYEAERRFTRPGRRGCY